MKIFLSGLEGGDSSTVIKKMMADGKRFKWNLMSYYYISKSKEELAVDIRNHSEMILIDSGAHSFQKGKKVDWDKYTREYAEFIKRFDRDNVLGYFEMDVDNVLGYEKVLELRSILESASDKIIPVWHKNRGIEEYKKMCRDYAGKVVAITGFKNEDIRDEQYLMFLKYAKKYNCRVHCLGMTRKKVLDKVPFDYADSSSWIQHSIYGNIVGHKVYKAKKLNYAHENKKKVIKHNFEEYEKIQKYYYQKWKRVCND